MSRTLRSQSGSILVEAMTGLTAFTVMALGFSSLNITTVKSNLTGRGLTAAACLARDVIETHSAEDFTTVASGSDLVNEIGETTGDNRIYQRTWTIAAGPTPDTKQISVTVTWDAGTRQQISLRSLLLE